VPFRDTAELTVGAMMPMMRKLGVVAAVDLMVAGVVLAACTSSSTPPHRTTTGAVAWISTPAPPTTSTTTTTTTLVPAPPCSASVLRPRVGAGGVGLGNYVVPIYLTNVGKVTCRLSGYPTLTAITTAGARILLKPGHGTYFGDMNAVDLRPGARGEFLLAGTDMCSTHPVYREVVVELPSGKGSFLTKSFPPCGPIHGFDESRLGVTPPVPGVFVPVPGTLASLQVRVELPPRVEGGHVLHYSVVLSNPGPRAVTFSPCPGYTEFLTLVNGSRVQAHTWSYELNCQAIGRLQADKTARFAMEMAVPRESQVWVAKFSWELDTGNGPFAGTAVRVDP